VLPTQSVEGRTPRLEGVRSWVVVAGTGRRFLMSKALSEVTRVLGSRLADVGCGLISGGWPGVDDQCTRAFAGRLEARGLPVAERLVQVVVDGRRPEFAAGQLVEVESGDREWVEQIVRADAVVLLGGLGGTWTTGELGYAYGKAVLPIAGTGGDAEAFHRHVTERWERYPMPRVARADFDQLRNPLPDVVENVIAIIQKLGGDAGT
jgi:hypothetical protein